MKAVVWHGVGDIRLDDVPEPAVERPTDAIVRLTASAICGSDLHFIRGTFPGMKPGTILGHEGVGVVEAVGADVRNLDVGARVLVAATIACGSCRYCRTGHTAQCDRATPGGPRTGAAFFGGPAASGAYPGLQAERARIPFANVGLVRLPDDVSDEQAILLSDMFPTGYFGAELAEVAPGDTVAVFGCGPVGLFAILAAQLRGAGRVFAIDREPSRLAKARTLGAETVDFDAEDPVGTIVRLTDGTGVDRAIEAVGVDALRPRRGPAAEGLAARAEEFRREQRTVAPETRPLGDQWVPGDAPSLALEWAVDALAKAGTLAVIGAYPPAARTFPIGAAMLKNLTVRAGVCDHRKYLPGLVELVKSGAVDPLLVLDRVAPLGDALDAYRNFDTRQPGWGKVALAMR